MCFDNHFFWIPFTSVWNHLCHKRHSIELNHNNTNLELNENTTVLKAVIVPTLDMKALSPFEFKPVNKKRNISVTDRHFHCFYKVETHFCRHLSSITLFLIYLGPLFHRSNPLSNNLRIYLSKIYINEWCWIRMSAVSIWMNTTGLLIMHNIDFINSKWSSSFPFLNDLYSGVAVHTFN